ncbi:MAG: HAMP domain-containing histidine kinase [Bacteroidia bacterium]|nr:HAMP domain-containing histidine kinase [Bacteroidia bacterium]
MLHLAPKWIMYDEFWRALKRRNLWLINMRYIAVAMLLSVIIFSIALSDISLDEFLITALAGGILIYNLILHRTHHLTPDGFAAFNGLHFALIQMCLDFLALLALIYISGGVESPFLYFFIFHVIIGSLILPMRVISVLISVTLVVAVSGAMMELHGVIPHMHAQGFIPDDHYLSETFIGVQFVFLALTLFVSNYLANSISKELYLRERALTIALRKLGDAEQAKSRYVMSVVHDLKTPIAAATTYLNMILDGSVGAVPEAMQRPLERSQARMMNAIQVVNDILQLTQLKLEEKPVITQVNLTELIDEIYQEMRVLFIAKKIRFSTWIGAQQDLHIEAEPRLLKLALSNLISNTHKYTPAEGRVEIHIHQRDESVSIEIADSGMGIPPEEQEKIFEDFYRSTLSKKHGIEGTGLGLSVVKHILRQFNGSIRVESPSRLENGPEFPGSAFIITLPRSFTWTQPDIEDLAV